MSTVVYYFDNYADAAAKTTANAIATSTSYIIESQNDHTYFQIAAVDTGSVPSGVYQATFDLSTTAAGSTIYYICYRYNNVYYYDTQADATSLNTPFLGGGTSTVLGGDVDLPAGYTHWKIQSALFDDNTSATAPTGTYANGFDISTLSDYNSAAFYNIYHVSASVPCFLEGSEILCRVNDVDTYLPIEQIRKGVLVKTSRDGYKAVAAIGKSPLHNPGTAERTKDRLYKCSPEKYPGLTKDLFLTGCHSILVDNLTEVERQKTVEELRQVFVTDKKYRLMACIDERAEPWVSEGNYTIWHVALENADPKMNYGVYASGLLVETCSVNYLTNRAGMTLV